MRLSLATRVGVALLAAVTLVVGMAPLPRPSAPVPVGSLGEVLPPTDTRPSPDPGPIVTGFEAKGYVSYYRYGDPTFHGGCAAIRDAANWSAFWAVHTWGIAQAPSTPAIDFGKEIVLVCLFGYTTDCCGSYVNITAVDRDGDGYSVSVDLHSQTSMLTMLSNPYHIQAVTRTDGPVRFHLHGPHGPAIPEIPPVP